MTASLAIGTEIAEEIVALLGLTVAIPTLLLHNVVQTRAQALTDILQHEAVAVVAAQAEQGQAA